MWSAEIDYKYKTLSKYNQNTCDNISLKINIII